MAFLRISFRQAPQTLVMEGIAAQNSRLCDRERDSHLQRVSHRRPVHMMEMNPAIVFSAHSIELNERIPLAAALGTVRSQSAHGCPSMAPRLSENSSLRISMRAGADHGCVPVMFIRGEASRMRLAPGQRLGQRSISMKRRTDSAASERLQDLVCPKPLITPNSSSSLHPPARPCHSARGPDRSMQESDTRGGYILAVQRALETA